MEPYLQRDIDEPSAGATVASFIAQLEKRYPHGRICAPVQRNCDKPEHVAITAALETGLTIVAEGVMTDATTGAVFAAMTSESVLETTGAALMTRSVHGILIVDQQIGVGTTAAMTHRDGKPEVDITLYISATLPTTQRSSYRTVSTTTTTIGRRTAHMIIDTTMTILTIRATPEYGRLSMPPLT